jgi:hypothetical protein
MPLVERRFVWIAGALVLALATVQISAALGDSQTWDEAIHLAAGYSIWRTGDYRINPQHPALGHLLHAVPLLLLRPELRLDRRSWADADARMLGEELLYEGSQPPDRLLFAGRLVAMLCTWLLAAALAGWLRRRAGAAVALTALALFSLDPTVLALGRYVTNDITTALFFFLACAFWIDYLDTGRRLWPATLALSAATFSKHSALILLPAFALLALLRRRSLWRPACVFAASWAGLFLLVHAPEVKASYDYVVRQERWGPYRGRSLQQQADRTTAIGATLHWLGRRGLPPYAWFVGLNSQALYFRGSHSYFLGRISDQGSPWYFPVAIAVKTPLAVLLLAAAAAAALTVRRRWPGPAATGLAVPILLFLAAAAASSLNIGIRHLLPLFAPAYALLAMLVWSLDLRALALAAVAGAAAESAWIYPHHLSFFNAAAGGPLHGPQYVLDSNIDWGQDGKRLAAYQKQSGHQPLCVMYFGTARLGDLGLWWEDVFRDGRLRDDCVAAVSVTPLYGLYLDGDPLAPLRRRTPLGRVGYSIYLYDLRRR